MRDAELPWREVFDRSPVAMSLVDVHGRQVAGNAAYAALLGYSVDDLHRLDVGTITREEDRAWAASYLTRLRTGDLEEYTTAKRYVRADGSEVQTVLRATAIRDDDGQCVALLGVIEPTGERQLVDDARLRSFLEYAQSTFTVVDEHGEVLETSGRYQPVLGYPADFWEHRTLFDLLQPGELERAMAFRERLLVTPGQPLVEEFNVRGADGSAQLLSVQAVNLLARPDVGGIVFTSQNITEQRRLMAELAQRRETAEAVAEARTNLLATVSHELRNPLHAVLGIAELLAAESLSPRAAELAATLAQQLNGLANVTQDLLDTARLDAGSVTLSPGPCNLRALLDEVVELGRATAGPRSLAVAAVVANDVPPWVSADQQRLRQVLRNLVGNAVKFTPDGSVIVDVRMVTDRVVISVTDTGVGIPADEVQLVMEPFRTASTAGDERGAGLGLAIVQRLVAAMGGQMSLTSVAGQGSTFRLELPLPVAQPPVPVIATAATAGVRVLVVEDNAINQRIARSQLEHLQMAAIIAESGERALELMGSPDAPEVDVILMDQQLPGIDGVETTRRLRELGPHVAAIPVVGLTASASAADRDSFLAAGMDGFVAKPATLDDIRTAITDALAGLKAAAGVRESAGESTADEDSGLVPVFDRAAIARLEEEFGDPHVVIGLVAAFLGELPSRGIALREAMASGDLVAAGRVAHTLKASARLLAAARLGDVCQSIERGEPADDAGLAALLAATEEAMSQWRSARLGPDAAGGAG